MDSDINNFDKVVSSCERFSIKKERKWSKYAAHAKVWFQYTLLILFVFYIQEYSLTEDKSYLSV